MTLQDEEIILLHKEFRDNVTNSLREIKQELREVATKSDVAQMGVRVESLEGDKKLVIGGLLALQFIGGGFLWVISKIWRGE